MQSFKKKFKEWVYSFSTEDHYAEYDPNNIPNFNMGFRSRSHLGKGNGNPSSLHLTGDEEMNIGLDPVDTIDFDDLDNINNTNSIMSGGQEGVSEVLLAWRHIDSWTEEHNPDLNATLGDPVTNNDINQAEEDLEISLPPSVKVSLRIHDGQEDLESMTGTSGLIYGLQLMTLDQIVAMTQAWRNVASNLKRHQNYNNNNNNNIIINNSQSTSLRVSMDNSTDSVNINIATNSSSNDFISNSNSMSTETQRNQFKLPFIPQQKSIPPDSVQPVYAHAQWIPMVTDHAGNHIGVDLAPGPQGICGQVIIFGRDFDSKYVVAKNWGEFLLSFANDLEEGNWWLVEESDDYLAGDGELVFRDKQNGGPIQDYLEVLKKRVILKYKQSLTHDPATTVINTTTANAMAGATPSIQQNNNPQLLQTVAPEPIGIQPTKSSFVQKNINTSKESLKVDDEGDVEAIITEDEDEEQNKTQDSGNIDDDTLAQPKEDFEDNNDRDSEVNNDIKETVKIGNNQDEAIQETAKDNLKDESKDESKDELKDEPKDELKDEPKDQPKDELKDESKDEPKDALMDESKEDNSVEDEGASKEEAEEEGQNDEKLDSIDKEKNEEDQDKKIEDVTNEFENVAL
ncbi:hypothetical protein RI543_004511 [Arxiozyma heterogenica]|uniref:Knr4/Smi1-like domain-containing protein n=1 Tax=Arxiozyma heterogenica TaxID=278026 RepID=A0AAN7WLR1_9SACH|nr:hypothetical protein RI543_004511 [Kazachstania heterogenica]